MDCCPNCGFLLKDRARRSNRQNDYYHSVVIPILAEYTGYEVKTADGVSEMHEVLKRSFGLSSTAELDTAEFSIFIDKVMRWAAAQSVYIPPPGPIPDAFSDMPSPNATPNG